MIHLLKVGLAFLAGYTAVTKAAPYIQAKVEAVDLDRMWEIWNEVDD